MDQAFNIASWLALHAAPVYVHVTGAATGGVGSGFYLPMVMIPEVIAPLADLMVVPVVGAVAAGVGLLVVGIIGLVEDRNEPVRLFFPLSIQFYLDRAHSTILQSWVARL